jgi:hypothetical protein
MLEIESGQTAASFAALEALRSRRPVRRLRFGCPIQRSLRLAPGIHELDSAAKLSFLAMMSPYRLCHAT